MFTSKVFCMQYTQRHFLILQRSSTSLWELCCQNSGNRTIAYRSEGLKSEWVWEVEGILKFWAGTFRRLNKIPISDFPDLFTSLSLSPPPHSLLSTSVWFLERSKVIVTFEGGSADRWLRLLSMFWRITLCNPLRSLCLQGRREVTTRLSYAISPW